MKKILFVGLVLLVSMMLAGFILAHEIKENKILVDEVVDAINNGKKAEDFKDWAKKKPYYISIMDQNGRFLVHPIYTQLQAWDKEIFDALSKATTEGLWVSFPWRGGKRHVYVRKTKSGLIVGSGHWD
ncbi:MAG: hypothetical protein JW755_04850 [Candidatus Aminicenantes bacterium]|nr:hypothetical protein [Candidatus Aminicenantes bacterium]